MIIYINIYLTSDVWSGRFKQDYVSIVAYYIHSKWKIQERIIGFRLLDVRIRELTQHNELYVYCNSTEI